MNKLWFLRRLDLFEGLSEAEMERIGTLMHMRTCRPGQELVVRPSGDRLYLMKVGRVRVLQGEVVAAVLGPGQLFGTSSLFGAAATHQRVVAIDDVVFCEAPAAQFLAAMTVHPRLAAKVAMVLARQLFELEQTVERSATDPVSSRLAQLLLRIARSDGTTPEVRGMSQADLARMIGSSRESVSRLIADWEREGIIRSRPRLIEFADEPALRRLAG
jgi:CRP/FNR family cyclic AMP-dependent transcriptional regulator